MPTFKRQTRCIDCNGAGVETSRPARHPGPRCDEHWREERRRRSKVAHANRIQDVYELTGEQYWALYEYQDRRCYGCRRATGQRKRLAVDHEHNKPGCEHDPKVGCPKCIRALLCGPCNKVVGILDADALRRLVEVLENPPAQRFMRSGTIDGEVL
jgi:Recombination endonuclease VII